MSASGCRRWNQRQRHASYNSNRTLRTLKTPHRTEDRFETRFPNPHIRACHRLQQVLNVHPGEEGAAGMPVAVDQRGHCRYETGCIPKTPGMELFEGNTSEPRICAKNKTLPSPVARLPSHGWRPWFQDHPRVNVTAVSDSRTRYIRADDFIPLAPFLSTR